MTTLSIEKQGIDVEYAGTEFRLDPDLIEKATGKDYIDVTDHEVLKIVEEDPALPGEPRRIGDVL
jgi:F420-dependent methylenetetrahydromethanopterin dehydrogenase